MKIKKLFTQHPAQNKESYWLHMRRALLFSGWMFLGGLACVVHAVFPFLLKRTASDIIKKLYVNYISA